MELIDHCEMCGGKGSFAALFLPVWGALAHATSSGEDHEILAQLGECEFHKSHIRLSPLPITAQDLMSDFAYKPGPDLGRALAALKESFRNEAWTSRVQGKLWLKNWQKNLAT